MSQSKKDIRAFRRGLGMTISHLAKLVDVDTTQIRKWERGLELPDQMDAARLAKVFGVGESELIQDQTTVYERATPGEGYTTASAGTGEFFSAKRPAPRGSRRVLDIFCGAGGLSHGFESTGEFVTTCGVDLLPDRIGSFLSNHLHANAVAGDLTALSMNELKCATGEVDIVIGGPPCQGFSSIRPFRTLTEGDPRNSLVEHYVLVISHLKPNWFLFENVVGLLTHQGGTRLYALLNGFRDAGYTIDWKVVNAASFGVPQNRERIVIVGNRLGIPFLWPEPTHRAEYRSVAGSRKEIIRTSPLFSMMLPNAVTLMEAIGDLPALEAGEEKTSYELEPVNSYQELMRRNASSLTLHKSTQHSDRMLEIIRHAGRNRNALPEGMVRSGFSSCYSRLDPDKPSNTITVNFVHPASNRCIHPYQNRALTPREGARIQSFPDTYKFKGTSAQVVKQIGNAVPPLLGQVLANSILKSEEKAGVN